MPWTSLTASRNAAILSCYSTFMGGITTQGRTIPTLPAFKPLCTSSRRLLRSHPTNFQGRNSPENRTLVLLAFTLAGVGALCQDFLITQHSGLARLWRSESAVVIFR